MNDDLRDRLDRLADRGPHRDPDDVIRSALAAAGRPVRSDRTTLDTPTLDSTTGAPITMHGGRIHRSDHRRHLTLAAAVLVAVAAGASSWLVLRNDDGVTVADQPSETTLSTETTLPSETTLPALPDDTDTGSTNATPTVGTRALDLATAAGVNRMVVAVGTEIAVVSGGEVVAFDTVPGGQFSDGEFVYVYSDGFNQAYDLTGNLVCTTEESIHHVTRRDDGSYVAAVVADEPAPVTSELGPMAYPLTAQDCQTGERQPIEPVYYTSGETESLTVQRVGGRTFHLLGDAEGNADIVNEDGLVVNGDVYAGWASFSADGSLVLFGRMGASPHFSEEVVLSDTLDGSVRWEQSLGGPFSFLGIASDRVVISVADSFDTLMAGEDGPPAPYRVRTFDLASGEPLGDVDVPGDLVVLAVG